MRTISPSEFNCIQSSGQHNCSVFCFVSLVGRGAIIISGAAVCGFIGPVKTHRTVVIVIANSCCYYHQLQSLFLATTFLLFKYMKSFSHSLNVLSLGIGQSSAKLKGYKFDV